MRKLPLALVIVLALGGCGGDEEDAPRRPEARVGAASGTEATTAAEPPPSRGNATSTPTEPPVVDDPLADLAVPVRDDEVIEARPTPLRAVTLAAGECAEVAEAPVRVLPRASAASIVGVGERFYLAAYEPLDGGREQVSIVELIAGSAPRLVVSIPVERPVAADRRIAAPALAATGAPGSEGQELGVAFTDASGSVQVALFDPSRPVAQPREADGDADLRFSPAIARVGLARIVAMTLAIPENTRAGEPPRTAMRLHVTRLDAQGAVLGRHDVTPLAGAGSHPSFLQTAGGHGDLLFVDARVALSVIHRVRFDGEGIPGETTVGRPINLSAEPPSLAAVRVGARELAAYAATGNMATRAVGLVDLGGTEPPEGLVPGLGYGQPLTVRAIARASDAVFASEAPSAPAADAPHEVRVRSVRVSDTGARTMGTPLVFAGAARPAIAVDANGVIAVALEGGLVRLVRCGS